MPEPYFLGYAAQSAVRSQADAQSSPGLPVVITTGVEFPWGSCKALLFIEAEVVTLYYKDRDGGPDITVAVPIQPGYNPLYGAFKADFGAGNIGSCAIY